jgi:hypothetical protein
MSAAIRMTGTPLKRAPHRCRSDSCRYPMKINHLCLERRSSRARPLTGILINSQSSRRRCCFQACVESFHLITSPAAIGTQETQDT